MKNILVIHYSQSGQLTEIVNNIAKPLRGNPNFKITDCKIEMEKPFPFPWKKAAFFDVFPETFQQTPSPILPISESVMNQKYDLIIFGYSIWYLTPSLPTTSFLETEQAKQLFENTPVITVIGCRNMWIMAQEKMKLKLKVLNANLVGNIALVDRHINHVSVITIVDWMFTGVKKKKFGIFPKPGVSQKDIDESVKFGTIINDMLIDDTLLNIQDKLLEIGAVKIKPFLITVDKRANLLFSKWAKLISSKDKNRPFYLKLFNKYLIFAIWFIAPIVFIVFLITYLPLSAKINKDKKYYSSVFLKQRS